MTFHPLEKSYSFFLKTYLGFFFFSESETDESDRVRFRSVSAIAASRTELWAGKNPLIYISNFMITGRLAPIIKLS